MMARTTQRKRRRRARELSATVTSSSESDGGGSGSEDEHDESEKRKRRWQLRQDRKGKGKELVKEDDDDNKESSRSSLGGEEDDGEQEAEGPRQQQQQQQQSLSQRLPNSKGAIPQEEICGICLSEGGNERGKLDCCDHFFCFACIMEWSKVESRCPMCKQRFITVTRPALPGVTRGRTRPIRIPTRDQVYEPSDEEIRLFTDPYQNTVCTECQEAGDEGLLLLCDRCDAAAHTYCVGLGRSVPRGDWFCQACQSLLMESSAEEDEEEEDSTFCTSDMDEEEGSGTDSFITGLVGDICPNIFAGRTRRSAASQGQAPLRRSTRRGTRRNSLSDAASHDGFVISSVDPNRRRGFYPPFTETHPARTLSHQRQVQATVQHLRLQNMRENWDRYRNGEMQFGSVGNSVESSRPGSAGTSSAPHVPDGGSAPTASQSTRGATSATGDIERAWINMDRARRLEDRSASAAAASQETSAVAGRRSAGEVNPVGTPVSARTRERSHQVDVIARENNNSSRGPLVERNSQCDNHSRANNSSRGARDDRHQHHGGERSSKVSCGRKQALLELVENSNSRDSDSRASLRQQQQSVNARASGNGHMELLCGGENSRSGYHLRESNRLHLSRTGTNPKDNAAAAGSARSPTSILDEKDSSRGSGGVSTRRYVREAKEHQCANVQSILDDKDNSRGSGGVMTRWREAKDAQLLRGRSIVDDLSNSNSRGSAGPTTRKEADRSHPQSAAQDRDQQLPRNARRDEEMKAMKEQCWSLVHYALKSSLEKGAIDKVEFKQLARSATHTILSSLGVPGLKHVTDVVAVGTIICDHEHPTSSSLIPGCCASCVERHVKRYVKNLVKAKNAFA